MKIWTTEHNFDHPWETIVKAAWRKYPNPMNTGVIGVDVIKRKSCNGIMYTHRLVSSEWGFPKWSQRLIGSATYCYASEESLVDVKKREMTLKTTNLTFSDFISVEETVTYKADPDRPETNTILTQEAIVNVQGVPLGSYMEEMLTSKIITNANKGRQAMEWVVNKIDFEVQELANLARRNTDQFLNQTKKSFDEVIHFILHYPC